MDDDDDEAFLKADGFDDAFMGLTNTNGVIVAVYDKYKAIDILMSRDGMSEEDAIEFFDFNVAGAYVGKQTPIWVSLCGTEILDLE